MSTPQMSERYADAFRERLVRHVAEQRSPRHRRRVALGTGATLVFLLGGAVAAGASGWLTLPGATEVEELGAMHTQTLTGTASVDLGPRPEGASAVSISFVCLSPGSFTFDDGASVTCGENDQGTEATHLMAVSSLEGNLVTITTSADAFWTLRAGYVSTEITDWIVNESGQTYGVSNENGTPDLIAVIATNGEQGFVTRRDLEDADGTTAAQSFTTPDDALRWQQEHAGEVKLIPVYAEDGITQVGEFRID